MNNYYDFQTLTIKEFNGHPSSNDLLSITSIDLAPGKDIKDNLLFWDIKKILDQKVKEGYELKDSRNFFECGVGGSGYDLLISFFIGLSSNYSYDILKNLFKYLKDKHLIHNTLSKDSIEEYIEKAKMLVSKNFDLNVKAELISIDKKIDKTKIILQDKNDNRYEVQLLPDCGAIKIKRIEKTEQ